MCLCTRIDIYVSIPFNLGDIYVGLPLKGLNKKNQIEIKNVFLIMIFSNTAGKAAQDCPHRLTHRSSYLSSMKLRYLGN